MKKRILFAAGAAGMLAGCMSLASMGSDGPADPIFPETNSIIPLQKDRVWTFAFTQYDTNGAIVHAAALDYHVSIASQYGIVDDTVLVPLDRYNYHAQYSDYAYSYEKEFSGKGYLLTYRRLGPLEERGVYLIGEFKDSTITRYPVPQLWLAYPAGSGRTWQFKPDPLGDSVRSFSMEVMSSSCKAYMLDAGSISGIALMDSCYLYKQTSGDTVAYYTYNEKVGNIGYQQFVAGKLRQTTILKSLRVDSRMNVLE
jgi:hypothetical protein